MISAKHQDTIYQILSVFETGKTEPAYGSAHVLPDGAGITFGKHQSTDRSGSLDAILDQYIYEGGDYSSQIEPFIDWLAANGTAAEDPNNLSPRCDSLIAVLKMTGDDPVMRDAQDSVFAKRYWQPAMGHFTAMQLTLPLSMLVCYDTQIHSGDGSLGINGIRRKFPEGPPSSGGDEHQWVGAYLEARREALDTYTSSNAAKQKVVRGTVYRIDAMIAIVKEGNWHLDTPLHIARPRATVS